ncbi:microtubule-associated protein futsch-like isoform X3 [Branchiostoma lanceolatum]|uniref:microtubule-associated protein futsch-like isoform X3 n=1 Tax=Branchiostoma lanceolatum TaxID=7740 RepID=UPI0034528533
MGDTDVLADVTNTDVAMNGDNEVFEDSKVFTQKTSITLKKSNASSSSARSGSLSGDEDKKGMKRVSRSSKSSSSSYEKKKREPGRLATSAFAKFQQADANASSAPAKKINIKLSRSVRDRASETDTTMSTVKQIQDSSDKCKTCGKRVYPVEKLVADKNVYHNTCFKCAECNRTLRVGTYASIDGAIYCKPHFQQLFKLKGNYDEGFGKERAVKKWSAAQGDSPPDGIQKVEGQEPAKKQRRGRDGDAAVSKSRRDSNVSMKTKFFLEKIQDSKVDGPPATKSTSASSEVTKESKVRSLKSRFADKYKEKESGVPFSKKAVSTEKSKHKEEPLKSTSAPVDKAKDSKVPSTRKSTSDSVDKPKPKDTKVSTSLKTTTEKEKTDTKSLPRENIALTDKAKDIKVPTSVKTAPAKEKSEEKSSSPENTKSSKDAKDWDSLLSSNSKTPTKEKDRKFSSSEQIVTPDSGVDVESPSSQKNSRKSSRSKSFSDEEEEDGRKRKGSTTKSDTPQQLLSVKERMAMYRQSAEHPSSEKIKVKSNRTPIMPKSAQNVTSRMERYQSEITSSGEARKSTSGGDDRKSVATGTLADLRKRWESGDLLTYQEKESTSGTTTGDEMEETVGKSTSSASHKAIIRQEEAVVAQEIKAARSKFQSFEKDDEQKPRASQRMKTSSSDHDMNGVVDNGRSSPYRDEELFEQSNYENGRRSSTGDVEVVKSTTPTSDDRELVKAGTASNLKKRWESGDLQNYKERSGSSSSSSSEYAEEEEPVSVVASFSVEETKSAAPKPQPTPKEVPQPERREMKKSESLKKRYEEKLEKKEAKDEEREEAPRRALNRAPSFSRTMAAKFEKGAVRSRSSSSSSSSQEQDPDAEVVRATSHHHKEKPDKVVNLGLSARLRSMFEKGDVHNVEAPARKSPVAIPRSTSTPDISKAGRRDSTSSSSSEEGEAHAVKTSFSDDEVEHRKAEIKGPSAKSLRAMFETNKTEESGPTTLPKAKPKSVSLFKTPPLEKCRACEKTVYAMEKIATDHDTFHKSCFKCDQCKKVLSLGTFAGIHDKLYCKPHFKQLFQAKGNYDEGFGQVQRKHKWAPKSDSPEEDAQDKQQIEEVVEVKRPVPKRRPRSADLEEFDDKPPVQDDQDDEEFEVRRPVPVKRRSLPKSESPSESENEEEEEEEVVTRRSRSSSSSSREAPKGRSHSASSGEGSRGRSHSASSEERRTKRRSGSSSSMDEEERRQRELSLKEGSVEEEIKRARLYRQKLLRDSSQDEEDC